MIGVHIHIELAIEHSLYAVRVDPSHHSFLPLFSPHLLLPFLPPSSFLPFPISSSTPLFVFSCAQAWQVFANNQELLPSIKRVSRVLEVPWSRFGEISRNPLSLLSSNCIRRKLIQNFDSHSSPCECSQLLRSGYRRQVLIQHLQDSSNYMLNV